MAACLLLLTGWAVDLAVGGTPPARAAETSRPDSEVATVGRNTHVTSRKPGQVIQDFQSPSMAVDPGEPDHLVVGSRFDTPHRGCRVDYSTDGGATWQSTALESPPEGRCWAPQVTIDDAGSVYVTTFDSLDSGGSGGVYVYVSHDGGRTFSGPRRVRGPGDGFLPGIAADTSADSPHTGRLYITWYEIAPDPEQRYRAYLTFSDDGGRTWSDPTFLSTPDDWQYLPDVAVGPQGSVYVVFKDLSTCTGFFQGALTPTSSPTACPVGVIRSSDGGQTFDGSFEAATAVYDDLSVLAQSGVTVTPDGDVLVVFTSLPLDPGPGCAVEDVEVYVARSTDGGETWADPVRVNDEPCELPVEQRNPWIDAAPHGRVDVVFYDGRNDPDGALLDVYHASSHDGGVTFGANRRVTDRSFDGRVMFTPKTAGLQSQNFDRSNAVVSLDGAALAAWGDARNTAPNSPDGDPSTSASDVFWTRLSTAGEGQPRYVERVGGAGAFTTAVALSKATYSFATTVTVAPADSFVEGLVGGPLARRARGPLFLSPSGGLPPAVAAEMERLAPDHAYVLGSEEKLSAGVEDDLRSLGVEEITRIGGSDSYATARGVAAELGEARDGTALVVSGEEFPAAVTAGAYAATLGRPILPVRREEIPEDTRRALDESGVSRTVVVGGTDDVSEAVVEQLEEAGYAPVRVAGEDAYGTSTLLAERGAGASPRPVPTNVTYLASGRDWAGAVLAAPAVAYRGGTLVLSDGKSGASRFPTSHRDAIDGVVQIGCAALPATDGFAPTSDPPEGCGDLPGRIRQVRASARSIDSVEVSFPAATDRARAGPVTRYRVIQSRTPLTDAASVERARSLCQETGGVCSFEPTEAGEELALRVTDLRQATTYHYAVTPVPAQLPPGEWPSATATTFGLRRLGGPTRVQTATTTSRELYPTAGSAGGAVLASADSDGGLADALTGVPLAHRVGGPLLLTPAHGLHPDTAAELRRAVSAGSTVYLLGGASALSPAVASAVEELGFTPVRLAGSTRVETALAVAEELGRPVTLLLAGADRVADAVTAGAAAAEEGGAVLLTTAGQRHPAVTGYLDRHSGAAVHAVGGPAARAYPEARAVAGPDREGTAVAVAEAFFGEPAMAGVAGRQATADALSGAVHAAARGSPMLLTPGDRVHQAVARWLCSAGVRAGIIHGGTGVVAEVVEEDLRARLIDGC